MNIIDPNWDIISLHNFGNYNDTNNINILTGSAAAYLINNKSVKKLAKQKVTWHHDIVQNILYRKYKSKKNLFYTDETTSTNRIKQHIYLFEFKKYLFSLFINDTLSESMYLFKLIRIGNINYTLNNLIDYLFIMIVCIIIYYIFK